MDNIFTLVIQLKPPLLALYTSYNYHNYMFFDYFFSVYLQDLTSIKNYFIGLNLPSQSNDAVMQMFYP